MSVHLQRELEHLKKQVLSLCVLVEEQVELAVRALVERDQNLAHRVEARDADVDHRDVELEETCLKTLALHQPVASDLRFLVSVLKMNQELERIGDLAVNIAHKAVTFARFPELDIPFDLDGMWQKSQAMLHDSIESLIRRDALLAHQVCGRDSEVNGMKHDIRRRAEELIRQEPEGLTAWLALLAVARNLERVADHATNIAEDVIYLVEGRIIRHEEGASASI